MPPSTALASLLQISLHPFCREGILDKFLTIGPSTPTSTVYPIANLAIYVPVWLAYPMLVNQAWWVNGATLTSSPHADIGLYAQTLKKLYTMGSTVMSGTNAIQVTDITDMWLAPGPYYIAFACDQTTNATLFASAVGNLMFTIACGIKQQATAFALPTNPTLATATQDYIPMFGFSSRSVV